MRIGIVSVTHNHLANVERIVDIFNAARVERVVHTGDITQPKTLDALARLAAPLFGVFGINDRERAGLEAAARIHGFRIVDPPLELVWAERRVVVVHDPRELDPARLAACDVALHGHDHRRVLRRSHGALVVNPGECAGHLAGHNAVGILDLASLELEFPRF